MKTRQPENNLSKDAQEILQTQVIHIKRGRMNKFGFEPAWNSYFEFYLGDKYLKRPILKLEDVTFHLFLRKNLNDNDPTWHMPSFPLMKRRFKIGQAKIEGMLGRLTEAHLLEKVSGKRKGQKSADVTNTYILSDPIQDLEGFLLVAAAEEFPQPLKEEWISSPNTPLPETGKAPLTQNGYGPLPKTGNHKHTSIKHTSSTTDNNNSSDDSTATSNSIPKQDVVVALIEKGLGEKAAQRLSRYRRERVFQKIDYHDFLLESNPEKLKNPRGWLRRAIEDDYGTPDGYSPDWREQLTAATAAREQQEALIYARTAAQQEQGTETRQKLLKPLVDEYAPSEDVITQWISWVSHIGESNKVCGSVLGLCKVLAIKDKQVIIAAPNIFTADQVEQRCGLVLKKLAGKHFDIRFDKVELQIETPKEPPIGI